MIPTYSDIELMIDNASCACQVDFDDVTRQAIRMNIVQPLSDRLAEAQSDAEKWHADAILILGFAEILTEMQAMPSSSELIAAKNRVVSSIREEAFHVAIEAAAQKAYEDAGRFDTPDRIRALTDKPASPSVAEADWHRDDNDLGTLLYKLRPEVTRRGKGVMVNDITVRIERANGSETDIEPIVSLIHSTLAARGGE